MADFVCCLDMGTTNAKAAVIGRDGRSAGLGVSRHLDVGGAGAGAEFDASEHVSEALRLIGGALSDAGVKAADVAAVSVTSQRASVVPLGSARKRCGKAISWQDTRCGEAVTELALRLPPELFTRITGLL